MEHSPEEEGQDGGYSGSHPGIEHVAGSVALGVYSVVSRYSQGLPAA